MRNISGFWRAAVLVAVVAAAGANDAARAGDADFDMGAAFKQLFGRGGRQRPAEAGDAAQTPARIPRLAAGRALPLSLYNGTMTVAGRSDAMPGNFGDPGPGQAWWAVSLIGGPVPARAFGNVQVQIEEAVGPDGKSLLSRYTQANGNLLDPRNMAQHVRSVNAPGWDDAALPGMLVTMPPLRLNRAAPVIARLKGTAVFRTAVKHAEHDSGPLDPPDGAGETKGTPESRLKITRYENDGHQLRLEMPYDQDTFVELRAAGPKGNLIGVAQWVSQNGPNEVVAQFNRPLPKPFHLVRVTRMGVRDVAVPFALENFALLAPPPLPDPAADPLAKYVDDEEDMAAQLAEAAKLPLDDPYGEPRHPRLAADRPLPVALFMAGFSEQHAPGFRFGRSSRWNNNAGWTLGLYGAPVPARALQAKNATITRIALPDGTTVSPPSSISCSLDNVDRPFVVTRDHLRRNDESRYPIVLLNVNNLDFPRDTKTLAAVEGRIPFVTYQKLEVLDLGLMDMKVGATPNPDKPAAAPEEAAAEVADAKPADDPSADIDALHFKVERADDNGRYLYFTFNGTRERFAHITFADADGGPVLPEYGYLNQHGNGRLRAEIRFGENAAPEKVRVRLHRRVGLRELVVPFAMTDVDLVTLAALPDPYADPHVKFAGDEEDLADAENNPLDLPSAFVPTRVPRLPAKATMPMGLLSASFSQFINNNAETRARFGIYSGNDGGWSVRLYGSPVPARATRVKSARLIRVLDADGRAVRTPRTENLDTNFHNEQRGDGATPPAPTVDVGVSNLDLPLAATKLSRVEGEIVFSTYAKPVAVDAGVVKLEKDAKGEAHGLVVQTVNNDRRDVRFLIDLPRDEVEAVVLFDDAGKPVPQSGGYLDNRNDSQTRAVLYFEQGNTPPEKARVHIVRRMGMRDVVVPFLATDLDFTRPTLLPDPRGLPNAAFVGDEADGVEAENALAEALADVARRLEAEKKVREREARLAAGEPAEDPLEAAGPAVPDLNAVAVRRLDEPVRLAFTGVQFVYEAGAGNSPLPSMFGGNRPGAVLAFVAGAFPRGTYAVRGARLHTATNLAGQNVVVDGATSINTNSRQVERRGGLRGYWAGLRFPVLKLSAEDSVLGRATGEITYERGDGAEATVDLGVIKLQKDARGRHYGARMVQVNPPGNNNRYFRLRLDGVQANRIVRIDGIGPDGQPVNLERSGTNTNNNNVEFHLYLRQPEPPEGIRFEVVVRTDVERVTVPFVVENLDILAPGPTLDDLRGPEEDPLF